MAEPVELRVSYMAVQKKEQYIKRNLSEKYYNKYVAASAPHDARRKFCSVGISVPKSFSDSGFCNIYLPVSDLTFQQQNRNYSTCDVKLGMPDDDIPCVIDKLEADGSFSKHEAVVKVSELAEHHAESERNRRRRQNIKNFDLRTHLDKLKSGSKRVKYNPDKVSASAYYKLVDSAAFIKRQSARYKNLSNNPNHSEATLDVMKADMARYGGIIEDTKEIMAEYEVYMENNSIDRSFKDDSRLYPDLLSYDTSDVLGKPSISFDEHLEALHSGANVTKSAPKKEHKIDHRNPVGLEIIDDSADKSDTIEFN